MSELQGAVALAQLGKVADTVARRRATAADLTSQIADIPCVSAPHVPEGTTHSWWLYMLQVHGRDTQHFGNALLAEGVPAWVRYIIDPLYCSPVFTGPATYGSSGYPFSEFARQRFARGLCPRAEEALSRTIAIHWNENYTAEHVAHIATAIRKAAAL
jgi:dTDP-4-amino-4,6-dideoxygalactose transaminase